VSRWRAYYGATCCLTLCLLPALLFVSTVGRAAARLTAAEAASHIGEQATVHSLRDCRVRNLCEPLGGSVMAAAFTALRSEPIG
jgi:hypothetical protein